MRRGKMSRRLGIQMPLRGKREGKRTPREEKLSSQIPVIVTSERRQGHPVPVRRNYDNVKSLVKCNNSVSSGSIKGKCVFMECPFHS